MLTLLIFLFYFTRVIKFTISKILSTLLLGNNITIYVYQKGIYWKRKKIRSRTPVMQAF